MNPLAEGMETAKILIQRFFQRGLCQSGRPHGVSPGLQACYQFTGGGYQNLFGTVPTVMHTSLRGEHRTQGRGFARCQVRFFGRLSWPAKPSTEYKESNIFLRKSLVCSGKTGRFCTSGDAPEASHGIVNVLNLLRKACWGPSAINDAGFHGTFLNPSSTS